MAWEYEAAGGGANWVLTGVKVVMFLATFLKACLNISWYTFSERNNCTRLGTR